ncbi:MAG TPA: type II secretion system F family protein [Candidatus Bathyarchaeia archaeon]|nr:type II secretion system F family protein [Candidatus Bathyarchaeia archaeon]
MSIFTFVAKNNQGEIRRGKLEGKDSRTIAETLRGEGFFATSIVEEEKTEDSSGSSKWKIFSGVSLKDKMMFARHLGIMLSSGLSVPRALNVISNQTKSRNFKNALARIGEDVKTGSTLADSLEKGGVFDDLSVNMIRVGETGGNLEEVLELLADQLEKEHNLISKVRGAMYYPTVIVLIMIAIGIAMMTYVVPQLTAVFSDTQAVLPAPTKLIINTSNFMAGHKMLVLGLVLFIALSIVVFFKTKQGKKVAAWLFLKVPVIKNITLKVNNARFARIYSSLIRSGVPVIESLKIISETLTNCYYQEAFKQIGAGVQKGNPLHEELSAYPRLFPTLIVQMMEVGEETGKTVDVLTNLAHFYEEEIDQVTKNLSSIIEPVLMVIIGSAVGFFAISMIMPMYSIMDQM